MKIVIAPDSFKESLTAKQVCVAIERGFRDIFPMASYEHLPLADGGEGTVDVLTLGLNGSWKVSLVDGPTGVKTYAKWSLLDEGKTALIEVAAASGLDLLLPSERNPMITSTYGTGELLRLALDAGVDKILLGLGGSATNDGGAGIVQALGGMLLDSNGDELDKGGAALEHLASINLEKIHSRCKSVQLIVACDVSNPLCGKAGASHVYGPQKGASDEMIVSLDKALENFANVSSSYQSADPISQPGFGAAGGTPLGLSLLFNMEMKSGIEMVLDTLNADELIKDADLIITGEGQMDNQTLQGKTPFGIAKRAHARGIPVIGVAGSLGQEVDELYSRIDPLFGTVRAPQTLENVLEEAEKNVTRTSRNIASAIRLGMCFASVEVSNE
ncbi:glycerate kinase [Vibrio vulnificus]|uniref:glycerate kinase n=1 Tax=Vibrio vulnificus TaxID=672 RepID=UPI0005F273F7|nr:glycerate kinase [Vibrio vulnificus]EGR1892112.1 glycerate kinase [Vibrio vulnificus]EIO4106293.1 glycerate kinase [Vibrio vulnificus]EIX4874015.1 glycerate kinase [Vibrio vulnificus]EJC6733598.1 glycerate kinase [Vibrio vulnificus]EKZ9177837.1 glycerate kinase [Vibrio vulnificus]